MFGEPRVEFADAPGQKPQDPVTGGLRCKNNLAEHRGGHDAEFGVRQGRDVGGAFGPVDRGHLAEKLAGAAFAEDDLLAGRRADEDPHLAGDDEIDVR